MVECGLRNFPIMAIAQTAGFSTTFLGLTVLAQALTIEPSHDKPCIVGDAWAEECMSCVCLEGRIASCKPTLCAARLRRDLDDCKEGEITNVDCNTCRCKNNARVCTKYDCGKGSQRHTRKSKKKEKRITRKNWGVSKKMR